MAVHELFEIMSKNIQVCHGQGGTLVADQAEVSLEVEGRHRLSFNKVCSY